MEIDVHKLDAMRKAGEAHTLLDIREVQEVDTSTIEGALHIAMSEFLDRLGEVPKEQPLVVMCHGGGRSSQVVQWMHANGYENALNPAGGINAWPTEIDAGVPTY